VIAHRGDSFHAPENTLVAARRGWEAGADAWELDVHLTRDGVPVVIHDESLLRTTDVAERFAADPRARSGFLVADFDHAEIATLDAGSWFLGPSATRTATAFGTLDRLETHARDEYASGRVRVPTLAEALRLTDALDWQVNVEIKSFPNTNPALLDAVIAAVVETATADRVLISSFDHADVARVARSQPELATGVLAATPLFDPAYYVRDQIGADFYHPSSAVLGQQADAYRRGPAPDALRMADFEALQAKGVPVLVYTVNDVRPGGLASHLADCGAGGLFTDDPAGLRRLFPGDRSESLRRRLAQADGEGAR
jgi:glycerophosphoryl diester phosphodiesterase